MSKIPQAEWKAIAARHAQGESLSAIARSYGCTPPAIHYVLKRNGQKAVEKVEPSPGSAPSHSNEPRHEVDSPMMPSNGEIRLSLNRANEPAGGGNREPSPPPNGLVRGGQQRAAIGLAHSEQPHPAIGLTHSEHPRPTIEPAHSEHPRPTIELAHGEHPRPTIELAHSEHPRPTIGVAHSEHPRPTIGVAHSEQPRPTIGLAHSEQPPSANGPTRSERQPAADPDRPHGSFQATGRASTFTDGLDSVLRERAEAAIETFRSCFGAVLAEGSPHERARLRQAASDLMRVAARTTIVLDRLNALSERANARFNVGSNDNGRT